MTTDTNTAQSLSLTDGDGVLLPEFELLSPDDPRNEMPLALRTVRDETTAHNHYFYAPLEDLKFVTHRLG